ncbi:MAG: sulfatase-like hydrolase/transferase, partial [Anaerovoracaceae bacterium]
MTPFTVEDIAAFKEGFSVATAYFSFLQFAFYTIVGILLVLLMIFVFIKAPKRIDKINWKRNITLVLSILLLSGSAYFFAVKYKVLDTYFANLAYGFRDNGFSYSFLVSWLDRGINKPLNYSEEEILNIYSKKELISTVYVDKPSKKTTDKPNIIFVMLESFIDPTIAPGVTYSEDPIPNFRKLMKENSSGLLTVPTMGAGTANTEFEAITGMRAKFFGPGEYPYKTVLPERVAESFPFDLKAESYSTHAIHNHRGLFYGRNKV